MFEVDANGFPLDEWGDRHPEWLSALSQTALGAECPNGHWVTLTVVDGLLGNGDPIPEEHNDALLEPNPECSCGASIDGFVVDFRWL